MGICGPSCGNLDSPPSRANMSLIAIIELVIMGVVGVLCLVDLIDLINYLSKSNTWQVIQILQVIDYGLIVAGLCLIIIGLFCSISQYQIRTGILCFCIGAILAIVITILIINEGSNTRSLIFNICYIIMMTFLAWILWRQSGHL